MLEPVMGPVTDAVRRRARVADVGAGTGKLTRVIGALGCEVVAVDPDSSMLAALGENVPSVATLTGTAESLPFEDGGFDAVVVGQAWHWVDPAKGSREIGRVLRGSGVFGLIWNIRDDSQPWVRRLNAMMPEGRAQRMLAAGTPHVEEPFGAPQEHVWHWTRRLTRSELGDMVRSRSFYITAAPEQRQAVDDALNTLCDDLGFRDTETIELPYVTHAYRFIR
jgi:SAM-dependent methyltransferase